MISPADTTPSGPDLVAQVEEIFSTTGVFCRITCPARKPKTENCTFHGTIKECIEAGYRACLRCHPLTPAASARMRRSQNFWRPSMRIRKGVGLNRTLPIWVMTFPPYVGRSNVNTA